MKRARPTCGKALGAQVFGHRRAAVPRLQKQCVLLWLGPQAGRCIAHAAILPCVRTPHDRQSAEQCGWARAWDQHATTRHWAGRQAHFEPVGAGAGQHVHTKASTLWGRGRDKHGVIGRPSPTCSHSTEHERLTTLGQNSRAIAAAKQNLLTIASCMTPPGAHLQCRCNAGLRVSKWRCVVFRHVAKARQNDYGWGPRRRLHLRQAMLLIPADATLPRSLRFNCRL